MATFCNAVLALPPRLAGITPCRMTKNRSPVTPTSRTRITTVTHHGRSPSTDSPIRAEPVSALIGLSVLGDLPWWVTVVILVREVGVTGLRFFVIRHGVIPASRGGKAKTALQNVAIGLYLLPLTGWAATVRFWLMAAAVVITVVTGADYVAR